MTTYPDTRRDELARDIFFADNNRAPRLDLLADWEALCKSAASTPSGNTYAHNIADGLVAAGYRKPRTIASPEEIDGELLLKPAGYSDPFYSPSAGAPLKNVVTGVRFSLDELAGGGRFFPATVVWEPEAEATR